MALSPVGVGDYLRRREVPPVAPWLQPSKISRVMRRGRAVYVPGLPQGLSVGERFRLPEHVTAVTSVLKAQAQGTTFEVYGKPRVFGHRQRYTLRSVNPMDRLVEVVKAREASGGFAPHSAVTVGLTGAAGFFFPVSAALLSATDRVVALAKGNVLGPGFLPAAHGAALGIGGAIGFGASPTFWQDPSVLLLKHVGKAAGKAVLERALSIQAAVNRPFIEAGRSWWSQRQGLTALQYGLLW